jgi:hypothetical protein
LDHGGEIFEKPVIDLLAAGVGAVPISKTIGQGESPEGTVYQLKSKVVKGCRNDI